MNTLSRRDFLAAGAAAAATGTLALGNQASAQPSRPNLLFLLTDDQRWDALGCMGNPIVQTPNIDRLATEGVRFDHCFVTTSICMASRASILTGMYVSTHTVEDFASPLPPHVFPLSYPQLLRQAGYHTGFVGKWGVGNEMPVDAFDYWDGFPGQGKFIHEIDGEIRHLESLLGESAARGIRETPGGKPFCMSVSFKAPHVQDEDPKQYLYDPALADLYEDVDIPVPETADPRYFEQLPEFVKNSEGRVRWEKRFATPEMYQTSVKGYYRLVTGIDRAVGHLLDTLEALGQLDNTVIIFTSDNGILNGEHGLAGKWLMYEESIRVPLIIRDPRMAPALRGTVRDALTLNLDMAPTMLELGGVAVPAAVQGKSLVPFLHGETPPWRDAFFYEHHFASTGRAVKIPGSEGIRTRDWKYWRYVDETPLHEALYHIAEDPLETTNLADTPEHREMLEQMRETWQQWRNDIVPLEP